MTRSLSDRQIEQYSRQIILRELGGTGQQRLFGARSLVIGNGLAHETAVKYLAAAGVGTIDCWPLAAVGEPDAGRDALRFAPEGAGPDVVVRDLDRTADPGLTTRGTPLALDAYDVVIEVLAADARPQVSTLGRPRLGSIALTRDSQGLLLLIAGRTARVCPACARTSSAQGSVAPVPHRADATELALAGSMLALAALRFLAGIAADEAARALRLDHHAATWREVAIERLPAPCPRGCPAPDQPIATSDA